jgi:hypothetical protein
VSKCIVCMENEVYEIPGTTFTPLTCPQCNSRMSWTLTGRDHRDLGAALGRIAELEYEVKRLREALELFAERGRMAVVVAEEFITSKYGPFPDDDDYESAVLEEVRERISPSDCDDLRIILAARAALEVGKP